MLIAGEALFSSHAIWPPMLYVALRYHESPKIHESHLLGSQRKDLWKYFRICFGPKYVTVNE